MAGAQKGASEGINSFIVVMDLENVFWNGVYLIVPLAAKRLQKPDQNKWVRFTQAFPSLFNGEPYLFNGEP